MEQCTEKLKKSNGHQTMENCFASKVLRKEDITEMLSRKIG